MDLREYQRLAARTIDERQVPNEQLCNWALGLMGELGELAESFEGPQRDMELGDVFWYGAAFFTTLGRRFDFTPKEGSLWAFPHDSVLERCGSICEAVKKAVFHGKPLDEDCLLSHVRGVLADVCFWASVKDEDHLDKILRGNIAKLEERYPNGFKR